MNKDRPKLLKIFSFSVIVAMITQSFVQNSSVITHVPQLDFGTIYIHEVLY